MSRDHHAERIGRALFGFLVASVIFTILVYALLWQIHNNAVDSCERGNLIRAEFNERAGAFDEILTVLIQARTGEDSLKRQDGATQANRRETRKLLDARREISVVPLPDCEDVNPKPWPLD